MTSQKKENFKIISDFVRRILFDHIRRQENPELFISTDDANTNLLLIEWIVKNITED